MRRELELPRNLHAPRLAREAVARWYGESLDGEELDAGKLVVSELASNAVLHGSGRILLRSELYEDRLLIEVVNDGSGFAHAVREVPVDALSGRGLTIVDAIASRWGIDEGTTHVWAEIERPSPSQARARTRRERRIDAERTPLQPPRDADAGAKDLPWLGSSNGGPPNRRPGLRGGWRITIGIVARKQHGRYGVPADGDSVVV